MEGGGIQVELMDAEYVFEADFHDSRVKIYVTNFVFLFEGFEHFEEEKGLLTEAVLAEQVYYLERLVYQFIKFYFALRYSSSNPTHLIHPTITKQIMEFLICIPNQNN